MAPMDMWTRIEPPALFAQSLRKTPWLQGSALATAVWIRMATHSSAASQVMLHCVSRLLQFAWDTLSGCRTDRVDELKEGKEGSKHVKPS